VEEVKRELRLKYGVKDGGPMNYILGIKVMRDRPRRLITLSQRAYVERILDRFKMSNCNTVKTPLPPGIKLSKKDMLPNDAEREEMRDKPYAEALGAVMYLAWGTRPDLAYTVHILACVMSNPGMAHWNALRHILRYTKGTLDYSISYDGYNSEGLSPTTYSDSSLGDCIDTRRSTHRFVVTLSGGPVLWSAKRQDCVCLSTAEVEYVALVHAGKTIIWIKNFLNELRLHTNVTLLIWGDNKGSGSIATNTINYGRARHIQLAYFWL
jgi:hypothetical protein